MARTGRACTQDRDAAAYKPPDVVLVITGRFDRKPPLFYEMRLRHALEEIGKDSTTLDAYDDAAVACDRMGKDDEAIALMARKAEKIHAARLPDSQLREHRFRTWSNLASFRLNHWLRAGADRKRLKEIQTARDCLREALNLNPNSAREKYQMRLLNFMMRPQEAASAYRFLGNILGLPPFGLSESGALASKGYGDALEALPALIVLDDAWESVDVMNALSLALATDGKNVEAYLAQLRCRELIDEGKGTLQPFPVSKQELKAQVGPSQKPLPPDQIKHLEARYKALRTEAEAWQKRRTEHMMARLEAGRHPDTDPAFWKDFAESGPPPLNPSPMAEPGVQSGRAGIWPPLVAGLLAAGIALYAVRRWMERQYSRPSRAELVARPPKTREYRDPNARED